MNMGLDIGCSRFRSLRSQSGQLVGRSCRAAYAMLSDRPAVRKFLDRDSTPYAACDGQLLIAGDAVASVSELFQVRTFPLLPGGVIASKEPLARQVAAMLVDALLPQPDRGGELCCLALPGEGERGSANRENEFFTRLVHLRGYTPLVVNPAMALVLAELVNRSFTGIAMTFGAGRCHIAVGHQGAPIVQCSVPRGGDWIDEQFAREAKLFHWDRTGQPFVDHEAVLLRKQSLIGTLLQPANGDAEILASLYRDLLNLVAQQLLGELRQLRRPLDMPQPISVVYAGGAAQIAGFRDLLAQALPTSGLPLEIHEIRIAAESNYPVARGCLITAELEAAANGRRAKAA